MITTYQSGWGSEDFVKLAAEDTEPLPMTMRFYFRDGNVKVEYDLSNSIHKEWRINFAGNEQFARLLEIPARKWASAIKAVIGVLLVEERIVNPEDD